MIRGLLAFQFGGAVLLIIKYWGNTRKKLINTYYPSSGVANNDGDDNAILGVDRVRECITEIYTNRAAFIYIALGYLLSAVGVNTNYSNHAVIITIVVVSAILIASERVVAYFLSKTFYKEDIKISYSELPDYIDRCMGDKDMEEIFKTIED